MDIRAETHCCPLAILIDCWVKQSICLYLSTNLDPENIQSNINKTVRASFKTGENGDSKAQKMGRQYGNKPLCSHTLCLWRSNEAAVFTNNNNIVQLNELKDSLQLREHHLIPFPDFFFTHFFLNCFFLLSARALNKLAYNSITDNTCENW